ncbi:zinc finger protein 160-like isoform X2 [Cydia strobilella]|uniref:zinc finger protein 160-like isoform X2 n=1 Tax=Cydia strobilella TaxID=1100964 RepID=UPI003007BBC3
MDFDEIVVKESPGLCRCCLSEGCYKDLGSEYSWMSETEIYADMLLECFDISISQHPTGPNGSNRLICEVCITRLRDACNFKKQVLESEKKFVDMVGRGEFRPKVLLYQTQMKTERIMEIEEDGADDSGEVEYLEEDADFVDEELLKNEDYGEASVSEDITVSALAVKGKRGRPKKTAKPEKKAKVAKTEEKPKKAVAKDEIGLKNVKSTNYRKRRNLQIIFNNTSMIPFKWRQKYLCFYCGEDVPDYDALRKHTRAHEPCTLRDRALTRVSGTDVEIKVDVSDITCQLCTESPPNFDEIISHLIHKHNLPYDKHADLLIVKYRLGDLKCLFCEESFNHFSKLIVHVNNSHPLKVLSCNVCHQKFNKQRDLTAHFRSYHKKGGYTCNKCAISFPTNWALSNHKFKTHSSACNICFKSFSSSDKRLKHMKTEHVGDSLLQCGFCLKTMNTKQGFLRHAAGCTSAKDDSKSQHIIDDIVSIDDTERRPNVKQIRNNIACILNMSTAIPFKHFMNKFRCFYCSRHFIECDELKEHTMIEHPHCDSKFKSMKLRNREDISIKIDISSLSCKMCFEPMNDLDHLIDHLTSEHKARFDKSIEMNIQPFRLIKDNFACPFCGEVFRYFSTLLRHVSIAHTDNKNICMYCGNSFRTKPNLRAHVARRHKVGKIYNCVVCKLEFTRTVDLRSHMGRVHGDKTVDCSECPEKFVSQYAMQRHLITIHGSGHKCSYCGKLFTRNSFMDNHIRRTHLKEKNVQCLLCNDRFFDAALLKNHMVKHIGERNFHCDVCGKKFLWKKNLRGHMASHVKNATQALT